QRTAHWAQPVATTYIAPTYLGLDVPPQLYMTARQSYLTFPPSACPNSHKLEPVLPVLPPPSAPLLLSPG
ncbi:hypothetical protein CH063_10912, partial [Colletotrichum higginsianum]